MSTCARACLCVHVHVHVHSFVRVRVFAFVHADGVFQIICQNVRKREVGTHISQSSLLATARARGGRGGRGRGTGKIRRLTKNKHKTKMECDGWMGSARRKRQRHKVMAETLSFCLSRTRGGNTAPATSTSIWATSPPSSRHALAMSWVGRASLTIVPT